VERIAIISDIHGNMPALEAVLLDIEHRGIKRIMCLGDLVGKGPEPDKAIDRIRSMCEVVVQGNWDLGITNEQDTECGLWQQRKIGAARLDYLEHLPFSIDLLLSGKLVRLFHASPTSIFHRLKRKASKKDRQAMFDNTVLTGQSMDQRKPDIVGYGDIHIPYLLALKPAVCGSYEHRKDTGLILFNVGSVGTPYDGLTDACYCVLEGVRDSEQAASYSIQIVRTPYDIEKAAHLARTAEMPESERYIHEISTGLIYK
jgi:protein phosphatase